MGLSTKHVVAWVRSRALRLVASAMKRRTAHTECRTCSADGTLTMPSMSDSIMLALTSASACNLASKQTVGSPPRSAFVFDLFSSLLGSASCQRLDRVAPRKPRTQQVVASRCSRPEGSARSASTSTAYTPEMVKISMAKTAAAVGVRTGIHFMAAGTISRPRRTSRERRARAIRMSDRCKLVGEFIKLKSLGVAASHVERRPKIAWRPKA